MPRLVRLSIAAYRLLLYAYPKAFRRSYGWLMLQLFADCCRDAYRHRGGAGIGLLWLRAIPDLLARVCIERVNAMGDSTRSRRFVFTVLMVILALCLGGWLGYADSRSDDTGITAGLLLIFGAFLGALQPRRVWLMALVLGLCIPAANLIAILARGKNGDFSILIPATILPLIFAFAGAYLGAGIRRLFSGPHSQLS